MTNKQVTDSIAEQIGYDLDNFVAYAEELEEMGRTVSAERLRDIINEMEHLHFDLMYGEV